MIYTCKKECENEEKNRYKKTKQNKYNLARVFLILLILAVIIAIANNAFFSGTGAAVRGGGAKKSSLPDLTATHISLQDIGKRIENSSLLYNAQVGASIANIGDGRSKASVFRVGAKGSSLGNVKTTVSYLDSTGKLITSATTEYITITNYNGAFVDINVDPLMPYPGPNKWIESYTVHFLGLPINMPPTNETIRETYFTFYSQADASLVIRESNESNNYKENSYIVRCAYQDDDLYVYPYAPTCCIHRVDPLSTSYTSIRGDYCEDFPPYNPLYLPTG